MTDPRLGSEPPFPTPWPTVIVTPFETTDQVVWRDGKARCARHPHICLVRAVSIGINSLGHVCARCMREAKDDY